VSVDSTRLLVQAVKRNLGRFPADFMFQLIADEFAISRSQSVISKHRRPAPAYGTLRVHRAGRGDLVVGARQHPRDRGEHRDHAHVRAHASAGGHACGPGQAAAKVEDKTDALSPSHDNFSRNTRNQLKQVFETLRELMTPPDQPKRPTGFATPEEKAKKSQARGKA
jgi:hypothetical protein